MFTLRVMPESDESVTPASIVIARLGETFLEIAATAGPPVRNKVVGLPGVDELNVTEKSGPGHITGPGGVTLPGAMRIVPPALDNVAEELAGKFTVRGPPPAEPRICMAFPEALSLTTEEPAPKLTVAAAI